jgi:hypothetical protein
MTGLETIPPISPLKHHLRDNWRPGAAAEATTERFPSRLSMIPIMLL